MNPGTKVEGRFRVENLTPHVVNVFTEDNTLIPIPTSGRVARVRSIDRSVPALALGTRYVPLVKRRWGEVLDLPEPRDGILLIVSSYVLEKVRRDDLITPDFRDAVKLDGRKLAVRGFVMYDEEGDE